MKTAIDKHTAAPWTIHWGTAQGGDGHWIMDSQDMGELSRIAMVAFHDDASGDETRANAKLIAAAPELLAALVTCLDRMTGPYGNPRDGLKDWSGNRAINMAIEAIKKATA